MLTHHRRAGRHYYDRPERVIPALHYGAPEPDEASYYRWILARRYQAVGLLRSSAEAAIWSACGKSPQRKLALEQLVEAGKLIPVQVQDGKKPQLYHMPANALPMLNEPALEPRLLFLGPLDSILWDRKAIQQIFNFVYVWEVYKPAPQRCWGYYVLPVFYGERFVARVDSRLIGKTWVVSRWWWESDVTPGAEMLDALRAASSRFLQYLGADGVRIEDGVDRATDEALARL